MMRKIAAALMALMLCVTLTGCDMLEEMVQDALLSGIEKAMDGFLPGSGGDEDADDSARSQPPAASSEAAPAPDSTPQSSGAQEVQAPPDWDDMTEEEMAQYVAECMESDTLLYYPGMTGLVGKNNGEVKRMMGTNIPCTSQILFGGTPCTAYMSNDVSVGVWFFPPDHNELMDLWETVQAPGDYNMPEYNCFPDKYVVERIFLGGNEAVLGFLFLGREAYSIDAISRCLQQQPQITRLPAETGEGMEMGPIEDLDVYTYTVDGVEIAIAYNLAGVFQYVEIW